MPAKKSASASSRRPAAKSKAGSSARRSGARPAPKTTAAATRAAGRKTAHAKTGAKPNVKKATKAAAKKAAPSSAPKAKTTPKKPAKKVAAAATKRPVVKTARPKVATRAASPRPAATKTKATARPAPEAAKKAPRLAPHRQVEETAQVAAGELQGLRAKLVAEREQVMRLYENDMRMSLLPDEDVTDDLVDRANNAYSRELHFAISDNEREKLGLIDAALERMNQGVFGTCLSCRRPVPTPRLQAVPWARYCTDCQELAEKGLLREP